MKLRSFTLCWALKTDGCTVKDERLQIAHLFGIELRSKSFEAFLAELLNYLVISQSGWCLTTWLDDADYWLRPADMSVRMLPWDDLS